MAPKKGVSAKGGGDKKDDQKKEKGKSGGTAVKCKTMSKANLKEVLRIERKLGAFYTGGDVLWSSNGETLFCQAGSAVNQLNADDGKVDQVFECGEDEDVTAMAISPDDETLVVASKNDLLRQFSWRESGTEVRRNWRAMLRTPVVRLEFDVNSRLLASGSADGALKVWDVVSKYCTHNFKGASGRFTVLRFHPKKHLLYGATSYHGTLFCWSLKDSALVQQLEAHTSTITDLQFIDSRKALTASRDKVVVLWDLDEAQKIRSIPVFECVESLLLLSAGDAGFSENHFATVGNRGVLRVWHAYSGKCVKEQTEEQAAVLASEADTVVVKAMFNRPKGLMAVVTYEQNIVLYDSESFEATKRLIGNNDQILDLALISSEERFLAICTNSPLIKVMDMDSSHTSLLKGHTDIVLCLAVAKAYPNLLVSGSKDSDVRVWSCHREEMKSIAKGAGHSHPVGAVAVSKLKADPKGNLQVLSGGEDTTLKLWLYNLDTSKLSCQFTVKAHDKDIMSIDMSWNNAIVATGSQDKSVKLWDSSDLSPVGVLRGHRRGVWCVRFSPHEPILASSSTDTTVKLWSIDELTCLRTFEGHECSVLRVAFVSDSQQLLTAGADGNLKLWNVRTNDCAGTFDGHEGRIWALVASDDEITFVSGAADSTINVWKDVTEQEREAALKKREKLLLEEQTLLNLMQQRQWSKALKLALNLEHPQRTLNIIKAILYDDDSAEKFHKTLTSLEEFQESTLIRFCVEWNTNAKHCYVAQRVCRELLSSAKAGVLLAKFKGLKENCEGLLPYTERHLERLSRLEQQSMILEYMLKNMHIAGTGH
ncbi:transducin beta protein 3-like [Tropilaelaps mercedesae]|uniref:Transducin beta protein 3-like n=1 Tax=Tropilaelaps mercedesae TaxID=418985 RepID=A0A1V9Y0K2_9ACAR|nr:transducin beta protein 3-like [Tropilaelaps mercedesae]